MKPGMVYDVRYSCVHRGLDERGIMRAVWTGETDRIGKRTLLDVDCGRTLYLFPDEIEDAEEAFNA